MISIQHFDDDGMEILQKISKATARRLEIYKRDGGICQWCSKELQFEESTLDHRIAKANGGTNAKENILLSCSRCNKKKSDMPPDEFEKKISEVRRRNLAAKWYQEKAGKFA